MVPIRSEPRRLRSTAPIRRERRRLHGIPSVRTRRGAPMHSDEVAGRMDQNRGGQDERDGASRRPSVCLHILCDSAMPWLDGAICAPSAFGVAIFTAPDCRIPAEVFSHLVRMPRRSDRSDHGA